MMYYKTSADRSTGHCTVEIQGVKVVFTQPVDGSVFVIANSEGYWCTESRSKEGRHWQSYATCDYHLYEINLLTSKDGAIAIAEEEDYEFMKLAQHGFTEVTAIPFSEWLSYCPKHITFEEWLEHYGVLGDACRDYMQHHYGNETHTLYIWEKLMDEECAMHPQWALAD